MSVPVSARAASRGLSPGLFASLRRLGLQPASELAAPSAGVLDERLLPVRAELAAVLPWPGLPRGSTLAVVGSTSLTLATLAEATARGSWAAVVGRPDLGLLAAHELGADLDRLALIPDPGRDVAEVVATLLDGVDVVALATRSLTAGFRGRAPGASTMAARKLSARARHCGSVLLVDTPWPGARCCLRAGTSRWRGLHPGHGRLRMHELTVGATGRGRERHGELLLPRPVPALADDHGPLESPDPRENLEHTGAGR